MAKIRNVNIGELVPNPNNPRTITKDALEKLTQSIVDFPEMLELRPIVVDAEMVVLGGNMRLKACKRAGLATVPVVMADELTDEQKRQFIIKDNVSGGEWELSGLLDEYNVDELTAWGLDESIFGIADIDDDDEVLDTSGDDNTPDVPEQPETVLGDVWTLGRHVLVCGDSTEQTTMDKLLNGKLASLVFTDPPYGITYQSNRKVGAGKRFDVLENDDVVLNIVPSMVANSEPNAHWYVWTAQKVAQQWVDQLGDAYTSTIVWSKGGNGMGNLTGGYALNYELALFSNRENKPLNGPREGAVWEIAKDAPQTYKHPTQKPVALSVYAIGKSTRPFEIVLDMFGGSGSTLIGCEKTKRVGRLVELSPKYCDVIVRRWVLFARENGLELNVLLNGEPYDGKLTESENAKG